MNNKPVADWMSHDDVRKQVVTQSLMSRSKELRLASSKCRKAYTREFMDQPMQWLADAFDEAAAVLEARLAGLKPAAADPILQDFLDYAHRKVVEAFGSPGGNEGAG
jgi:hypothetical protein